MRHVASTMPLLLLQCWAIIMVVVVVGPLFSCAPVAEAFVPSSIDPQHRVTNNNNKILFPVQPQLDSSSSRLFLSSSSDSDGKEQEESAAVKWAREQARELQDDQEVKEEVPEPTVAEVLDDEVQALTVNEDSSPEVADKTTEEKQVANDVVAQEEAEDGQQTNNDKKKTYVIVGAGWAGWGAAKALCEASEAAGGDGDSKVIILDALPDPTGRTPYLSKTGKPVEAGTRGFWKDYPNINKVCSELGLDEDKVFTDFTNSSFYSPDGLEATAPVFSNAKFPEFENNKIPFLSSLSGQKLPTLPSPLGQVLATFPLFERIPLADRASMIGLLAATIDCLGNNENEQVQRQYDRMTGHELFVRFGLSPRLVEDFIKPTLLVGLFKPPEELSALVVMELLYYYALAHVDSFDVRWIRNGTVADSLTAPLAEKLESDYDLDIRGGCRVGSIRTTKLSNGNNKVSEIEYTDQRGNKQCIQNVDGVVLALSSKGMQNIVGGSPDLAQFPVFSKAASCQGIDVISVRLWLDKTVPTRTPANVLSRYNELRGAGGTFFMLDQFQNENQEELWGSDDVQGSVVACDFYNAGPLLSLPDDALVETLMEDLLPSAVPAFASATAVDSWVGRYPGAVSWFAPGSFDKRPPLEGAGEQLANLKCAGDWVRMGEREHGAKGLCQERAYVSGLEAANSLLRGEPSSSGRQRYQHAVLPVREDEAQFQAAASLNKQVMQFIPRFWVRQH